MFGQEELDNNLRMKSEKFYSSYVYLLLLMLMPNINYAQIGIGTTTPNNMLEINSGVTATTGLRFTNLTSAVTAGASASKALGVDANGDVSLYTIPIPIPIEEVSTYGPYTTNPGTILTLGEIQFRFPNPWPFAGAGIQFRSNSGATLAITCIRHEEYEPAPPYFGGQYFSGTFNLAANTGGFLEIDSGGLDANEILVYTILTNSGGVYEISVADRNGQYFYLFGERIR